MTVSFSASLTGRFSVDGEGEDCRVVVIRVVNPDGPVKGDKVFDGGATRAVMFLIRFVNSDDDSGDIEGDPIARALADLFNTGGDGDGESRRVVILGRLMDFSY
ncbi:MAG: hypothetical protein MPK06_05855 [Alphaproteobacteria bacterium]|nr:hypothetical protein [Alphaproteobacteria bacterium]MDA8003901.1 hypothetical protein [Alphaproteobacteria bacterium]MDA8006045.1 hypothetical protein [Alphaproteobacteria bacterium]MDA8013189.1 hypothetical protein [Alphaproteobacteria bacterium]